MNALSQNDIPGYVRKLSTIAFIFPLLFIVACLFLNLIRTDYNPLTHPMSDYAVGRWGFIMSLAFMLFGSGLIALVIVMYFIGPRSTLAKVALVFLSICGIGLFAAAFFRTDLPGAEPTTSGQIHIIDAIINLLSITIGSFLLSVSFRGDKTWRPFYKLSFLLASLIILAFLGWFFSPDRIYGLANKIFAISLTFWVIFTARYSSIILRDYSKKILT